MASESPTGGGKARGQCIQSRPTRAEPPFSAPFMFWLAIARLVALAHARPDQAGPRLLRHITPPAWIVPAVQLPFLDRPNDGAS